MSKAEISDVKARYSRLIARLYDSSGGSYIETIGPNDNYTATFIGIEEPGEISADMTSAFVWCWSLKDYLKKELNTRGVSSVEFEQKINEFHALTLCSDVANRLKHGSLRKSRSGHFARLENEGTSFSQNEVESIVRSESGYTFNLKKDANIQLTANIVDQKGDILMDAMQCLEGSYEAWTKIAANWNVDF